MTDSYKLPGSSYDELIKIIQAYSSSRNGTAISLNEVAQASGMAKTVISRNNGFLVQTKLVTEGAKKAATDLCIKLGRAYAMQINEQITLLWNEIVNNDDFLNRMISTIQIKGEMAKTEFVNHIVFSSGNNKTNNARAGAAAIIEILKLTQLIDEKEGMISAKSGKSITSVEASSLTLEKNPCKPENESIQKNESLLRDLPSPETGYYIQSYTCESGKTAKLIIPENATADDLLAFSDMLNIVLKRKFKLKID